MKKLKLNIKSVKELTRTEQRSINGGSAMVTCTADCGEGVSVSCNASGLYCTAIDYVGCASDEEVAACPPVM